MKNFLEQPLKNLILAKYQGNRYSVFDVELNNGNFYYIPDTKTYYIDGEIQLIELIEYGMVFHAMRGRESSSEAKERLKRNPSQFEETLDYFTTKINESHFRLMMHDNVNVPEYTNYVKYNSSKGGRIFANNIKVDVFDLVDIIVKCAYHAKVQVWSELNYNLKRLW